MKISLANTRLRGSRLVSLAVATMVLGVCGCEKAVTPTAPQAEVAVADKSQANGNPPQTQKKSVQSTKIADKKGKPSRGTSEAKALPVVAPAVEAPVISKSDPVTVDTVSAPVAPEATAKETLPSPTVSTAIATIAIAATAIAPATTLSPEPKVAELAPTIPVPTPVEDSYLGIVGTMTIDFRSRVFPEEDDVYKVDLTCADAIRIRGRILRKGRQFSSILGREQRSLQFEYDLRFSIFNPENKSEIKEAGAWRGVLTVARDGTYRPQNLVIESGLASSAAGSKAFGGTLRGKSEDKPGFLGKVREYTRVFGKRKVAIAVQRTDPLQFENLILAGGPLDIYPETRVSGNLDFDYDTGNWLTDGISIVTGAIKDKLTGSIKWSEDPQRETNGKGQYDFNIRYNESSVRGTEDEGSFFEGASDEEAFFAVDNRIPTISGSISYKDTFQKMEDSDEPKVVRSEVRYALKGEGVDKRQLFTFMKLWLLISGPVNDE